MLEIITKIDNTVKKYNMLAPGDRVIVGVSGGPDSMLLLHYLLTVRDAMELDIVVANVEHGIRGDESRADTQFVVDYCHQHNVEVHTLSIDAVIEASQQGMGVEEYSRNRRYEFFNSLNPTKIATAHSLSDNVETVLFRMARGTALKGASGIKPVRDNVIRPLIDCTSQEIRRYCQDNGIDYRVDSTNGDTRYSRNFVRHNIVPNFRELNPSFESTFMHFITACDRDDDYITSVAMQCYDCVVTDKGISVAEITKYHISVINRVLIAYADSFGLSLDRHHIGEIVNLLYSSGRYQIKGDYFAVSNKQYLRITNMKNITQTASVCDLCEVCVDEFLTNCELLKNEFDFFLDYDRIVGNIYIRTRQSGDTIVPAGRGCTKSIKKLFNELAVDVEKRDSLPLVCDDNGIIAIKDCCVADRVRISSNTKRVLLFNIRMED
ncbi:MAG: tRNA lysidine(34) synthetase TilS [Eubacterium sp.]